MSWDVSLRCECKCGRDIEYEVRNLTYNNSQLLSALEMDPKRDEEIEGFIWAMKAETAIAELTRNQTKYKHLEPANGWGGIVDTLDFLYKLLIICEKHPNGKIRWG